MSDLRQRAVDSVELFNAADYDGMRALLGPGFRYSETGTQTGPLPTPAG
ncbi:hypothetical protein I4I73_32910, partial [Pseudonocardia sp. KRD-184]|nr:hypothetical protein [Pseudonocardia oceani]